MGEGTYNAMKENAWLVRLREHFPPTGALIVQRLPRYSRDMRIKEVSQLEGRYGQYALFLVVMRRGRGRLQVGEDPVNRDGDEAELGHEGRDEAWEEEGHGENGLDNMRG